MKRTDNTRLPGHDELSEILEREEYRAVAAGKEDIHYPEFSTIIALLGRLDLAPDLFTKDVETIHQAVAQGDSLLGKMVGKLTIHEPDGQMRNLLDDCYDYLAEEDVPQPSDLIFVFGGKTPSRPEVAAKLYQRGLAAEIWMSGGNAIYAQNLLRTEADIYCDIAVVNGVPKTAISIERRSITVPDNVRASLNLLDKMGRDIKSFIIVNSPYTQRRGWVIFKKHLPDNVAIYRVNCSTKAEFSRENWYKQENTLRIVLNEFMKMRASVVYNTA